MSTHNICFYGELMKIILYLKKNTHLICSTAKHIFISFSGLPQLSLLLLFIGAILSRLLKL